MSARSGQNRSGDRREEVLGILLVAIGLLVGLSLLPQAALRLMGQAGEAGYQNLVGLAGKFVNESAKDLIGVLAYALPVAIAAWGVRLFAGKPSPVYARVALTALVLGLAAVLLIGLSTGPESQHFDWSAGRLGRLCAGSLQAGLGLAGAYVVTLVALLIFLIFFTGLSLRPLVRATASGVMLAAAGLGWLAAKAFAQLKSGRPRTRRKPADSREPEAEEEWQEAELDGETPAEAAAGTESPPVEEQEEFTFDLGEGDDKPDREAEARQRKVADDLSAGLRRGAAPDGEGPGYELPPLDLLDPPDPQKKVVSEDELARMGRVLMAKLADFSVEGELVNITRGPQVSTFEIKPAPGVKINRIAALADDLAMAMHAKRVRIIAPIPGKGAVGVELPNPVLEIVRGREVFESDSFRHSNLHLPIGLGKDLEGRIRVTDLTRMPHLLIAGTTGSGKSVCMNMVISSVLFLFGPDQVRLLMIDPKMIELNLYNGVPHLLHPVVTDAKETAAILKWTTFEMERRYRLLSRNSVRSIEDFNTRAASGKPLRSLSDDPADAVGRMPYIIILVDELSDLMCSEVKNEIEAGLVRLAQMARAVGIHLVVATQRPSVDVITGLIKANFPSRLSFQVYSKIDSRTILDASGAEQLLRNGDMLFVPSGQSDPIRIQGAYLSSGESERLAAYWRSQPWYEGEEEPGEEGGAAPEVRRKTILDQLGDSPALDGEDGERDELFNEAARLVVRHDQGSTSLIQRRLKVGYARAGRIVDQLERAGILGPPDGSKAREVLVSEEDLPDYGVE